MTSLGYSTTPLRVEGVLIIPIVMSRNVRIIHILRVLLQDEVVGPKLSITSVTFDQLHE